MNFVSLLESCKLLLLLVPLNILLITPNMKSILFLLEYISFLNLFLLCNLYFPFLAQLFNGIWPCDFASSFIHFLIGSVSYALSANMYLSLYFFIFRIAEIANLVSNLGPL